MRTLGIDFGERRIGLAISDRDGRVAVPLETFERRDDRQAARVVHAIARRESVEAIVLGEPLRSDRSRGDASERIARFGARLGELTGLPVRYVDETLTSFEAEQRLGPRAPHGAVDAVAAQILLQEALDRWETIE